MKNIIFIAPPAAGKGTISSMICSKYNIPHIGAGDLLRNEIANCTKIGLEIKEGMKRGQFVSDELITKLLKKRLSNKDCKKGYVLDGYPRNIPQAEIYDNLLNELEFENSIVIFLDIDGVLWDWAFVKEQIACGKQKMGGSIKNFNPQSICALNYLI